jgi:excisionase family DNA binding protein
MNTKPVQRLLNTVQQAAEELGVGRSMVYQLIREKELQVVKIGRCTRIPRESTARYVERLRQAASR